MTNYRNRFRDKFGTERGYVRYILSVFENQIGTTRKFNIPDLRRVDRVVFVCLGNICRSAYAHHFGSTFLPVEVASFGLSTTTNIPAFPLAQIVSLDRGLDIAHHRTTDFSDFNIRPGDLLLVMEVRQARRLNELVGSRDDIQISLLGNWARPIRPHIHDPHTLSENYFHSCFGVIEDSIRNLKNEMEQLSAEQLH